MGIADRISSGVKEPSKGWLGVPSKPLVGLRKGFEAVQAAMRTGENVNGDEH